MSATSSVRRFRNLPASGADGVIGLTATPIVKGLRETWETVVNATTTDALVADGYLALVEIYAATEIDMKGASKTAGEWTAGAVRQRSGRIIGDIVSTWSRYTTKHFGGPAKTLLYSADTAHGADLCQAFQAAGHDFRQSTYRDSDEVTLSIVEGFDVPDVLIGVAKSRGIIVDFSRGPAFKPHRDIRGIARPQAPQR